MKGAKLFRLEWKHPEYIGADEYEFTTLYEYLHGFRALGKAIELGMRDEDILVKIDTLQPSLKAWKICLSHTYSRFKNCTAK